MLECTGKFRTISHLFLKRISAYRNLSYYELCLDKFGSTSDFFLIIFTTFVAHTNFSRSKATSKKSAPRRRHKLWHLVRKNVNVERIRLTDAYPLCFVVGASGGRGGFGGRGGGRGGRGGVGDRGGRGGGRGGRTWFFSHGPAHS